MNVIKKEKWNETRCQHVPKHGGKICQNKRKEGYSCCYVHLKREEKDNYDMNRLLKQGKTDEEIATWFENERLGRCKRTQKWSDKRRNNLDS